MSDSGGFGFGPIDPENAPEAIRQIVASIEQEHAQRLDKNKMRGEATALRLRGFLDKLAEDPQQLATFTSLMAGLMVEGKGNYLTAMVYGMSLMRTWDSLDFEQLLPENDASMVTLDEMAEGNPVQPTKIEDLDLGDG